MSATGSVDVVSFEYLPAASGKVKPNQIRNTALGTILFEQNIDTIFRDAVFKELKFMGVTMQNDTRKLTGVIEEFLIDDLGYSVDWTVRVKFVVTEDGQVTYDSTKEIIRKTSKFANPFGALNETIKLSIEELVKDATFLEAIN